MAERATMLAAIRQHLLRAQQRMKAHVDKHHSKWSFNIDNFVYLRLQPYISHRWLRAPTRKLCFKPFGPYKIGDVAYKLLLPLGSSVHLVFHVSLLKPAPPLSAWLFLRCLTLDGLQVLEHMLQRLFILIVGAIPQLLIKWSGLNDDLTTWEDADAIKQQFLAAPAWGHAATQGEGGCQHSFP
ncbi:unnamed protein product [Miscanthus lutarioriparius]|uniref:Tf2-1-like SH3-like domain-containing protein n=1 Tax=Miscanthus lutarioriparius TaxID=422564 RepID=A0A811RS80_9POAL|nr:unnamed protein product [Miscanthus lutarioriparius]